MVANSTKPIDNKPKKAKIMRVLSKREPQLVENTKNTLIFKGHATSQSVVDILRDISLLKKPNCKHLTRKNDILPFEDASSLEFLTSKNDCSLFVMGSHTKKRPNNVIMGRTFDGHILDMAEFGISNVVGINDIDGFKKGIGSKPLLLFNGEQWESDATYAKLQNLLIDLFRGDCPDKIALKGIDHVLSFNIHEGLISFRAYTVSMKKSGTKVPNASLQMMGPSFDLTLRRQNFAANDLWNIAVKKPKQLKTVVKKNMKRTNIGETLGRIHIQKQDLSKATGKLMHVLRNRNPKSKSKESAEL